MMVLAVPSPAVASHAGPLAGQWHFEPPLISDGQATPESSGHDLFTSADPGAAPAFTAGRFSQTFDFGNGDTTVIEVVGDPPVLEPPRVSVTAWVRSNGNPGPAEYVVAKGANGCFGASSWALYTGGGGVTDGLLRFYIDDTVSFFVTPPAPASIWDNAWHAVTGTFDGVAVRLYVDGAEVGSTPAPGAALAYAIASRRFSIGSYPNGSCRYPFRGGIDEVQVYDRALSPTEIARLHTHPGPGPPVLVPDAPGGGTLVPPTARFISGKSRSLRRATWMSALDSTTDPSLKVSKYQWDFTGDGRFDATCGDEAPAVSRPFRRAGNYPVTLQVTDTAGQQSKVEQLVTVGTAEINRSAKKVNTCEAPLGPNQPDTPGCVKTFAFGIVEVNGRGGADQCFKVVSRPVSLFVPSASQTKERLFDRRDYNATIKGSVSLNGLPIRMPDSVQTEYDSGKGTISLGDRAVQIPTPGGGSPFKVDIPLTKTVDVKRNRDYPRGYFKLFGGKAEAKLKGWGGLKRGAGVEVLLLERASLVKVSVKLPDAFSDAYRRTVEAWAAVRATNADGFSFEGMQIGPIGSIFLGPLQVNNLFFKYQRTGEVWQGGANFQLLGVSPVELKASPPPPEYGFGLRGGSFDYAGGGIAFPFPPRPQLFPGVGLKEIGGSIGVNPLRLTGRMAIDLAGGLTVDGSAFVAFATSAEPYDFPEQYAPPGLGFLAGRRLDSVSIAIGGQTAIEIPRLGKLDLVNGYVFYAYPSYAEFGGGFEFKQIPRLSVKGGATGFLAVDRELFNIEGGFNACVDLEITNFCLDVGGIISTKGIGFCAVVPVPLSPFGPTVPVQVSVGYAWGSSGPGFKLFSCDYGPYRVARPAARTSQAGRSFTVERGTPSTMLRVTGAGAPPSLVLTGPGGLRLLAPQTDPASVSNELVAIPLPEEDTTLVALKDPPAGRWTVEAAQGSAAITGLATASGLDKPSVRASVGGAGTRRVLRYRVRRDPGQRVTFVERGRRTYRVLGTARGARGRLGFAPADGPAGRRLIEAQIERDGVVTASLKVATYRASRPQRVARPRRLRVRRRTGGLVVSWARVQGAVSYAVSVRPRGAPAILRITRARRLRIGGVGATSRGSVLVGALDASGRAGFEARGAIPRRR